MLEMVSILVTLGTTVNNGNAEASSNHDFLCCATAGVAALANTSLERLVASSNATHLTVDSQADAEHVPLESLPQ